MTRLNLVQVKGLKEHVKRRGGVPRLYNTSDLDVSGGYTTSLGDTVCTRKGHVGSRFRGGSDLVPFFLSNVFRDRPESVRTPGIWNSDYLGRQE